MSEILDQQPMGQEKGKRTLWIVLAAIGAVLILCLVTIVIIVIVLDPGGIISRLRGTYDPIAQAAPPETQMFVNINLLQLQSSDTVRLVNTFAEAVGEEPFDDFQDIIADMDETVEEDTEMTFAQDVLPWIGQFAGLGFKDIVGVDVLEDDVNLFLIVEVRNKKKADEFLDKAMDRYREENDEGFIEETYEGATIYEVDTQYEDERFAFGRSKDLLIFSNKVNTLKDVIDAQKGDSLAESDDYKAIVAALPKERLLTFYTSFSFLESFYEEMDLPAELESSAQLDMLKGMGMSISAVEAGLQMDYIIAYNPEKLTDEQKATMQVEPGQPMTASFFPKETYLYLTSGHLDRTIESLQEGLLGAVEESEIDEAMEIFEEQFGINPLRDLFPYLDGEWAIGIFESPGGLLAEQLGVPLNLMLVIESSDPDAILNAAEKIAGGLEDTGQFDVLQTETGGIQFFELKDPYYDEAAFVYAVKDNILFISMDVGTIEAVYGDRVSLEQYSRYKDGWEAFPKDMRPVMYMDIEGIYRFITEDLGELTSTDLEEASFLKPIKTIEIATRTVDESLMHGALIIFIEGDNTQ